MSNSPQPVLLLVEDNALLLLEIEDALKEAGFDLVTAQSGASALMEIDKDCSRFGALVTDIDVGDGPSGWEIARHARSTCPNIPVIYMSGASSAAWAAEGVPKSIMLAKPFAPAQLVTAISTLMNDTQLSDPAA